MFIELNDASDKAWKKICDNAPTPFSDHSKQFEPFKKQIDHNNSNFKQETIPLYDAVLEIFTSKFWLAEKETSEYYEDFYRYVEIWHRHLAGAIPSETLLIIDHGKINSMIFQRISRQH